LSWRNSSDMRWRTARHAGRPRAINWLSERRRNTLGIFGPKSRSEKKPNCATAYKSSTYSPIATPRCGPRSSVSNTPNGRFWMGKSLVGGISIQERSAGSFRLAMMQRLRGEAAKVEPPAK